MAGDLGRFLLRGRGTREEEGEADRWASVVSEGRGDACAALSARSWASGRAGLLWGGWRAGLGAGVGRSIGEGGERAEHGFQASGGTSGSGPDRVERRFWAELIWFLGRWFPFLFLVFELHSNY